MDNGSVAKRMRRLYERLRNRAPLGRGVAIVPQDALLGMGWTQAEINAAEKYAPDGVPQSGDPVIVRWPR